MKTAESKNPKNNVHLTQVQRSYTQEKKRQFFSDARIQTKSFFNNPYSNSHNVVQTKLTVGQPGDKYEIEADAMADKVVQKLQRKENSETPFFSSTYGNTQLQTKCSECDGEDLQRKEEDVEEEPIQTKLQAQYAIQAKGTRMTADAGLEKQLKSSKGGGRVMSHTTRSAVETSFGTDFSSVRIHTGSNAVQMNQNLNAQAFTHGSDVYFNQGKYKPETTAGQHLLAHELTHVVQQSHGNGILKSIQKSGGNPEAADDCTLSDAEKLETLRSFGSQRRLREIMARETRHERNQSQGMRRSGLEQNLTDTIMSRANDAIFAEFGNLITDQDPARLNHPNIPLTTNSPNLTVHQPGTYGHQEVPNDSSAVRSIVRAARKFISDDLFAACITSVIDPVLLMMSRSLLQDVGRQFVVDYEEATFDGNTRFGSGPEGHVNMPSRASHIGHRYIHELMHYYVHENFRRTAVSRPLWTQTLMEGGAELMARHVIHNQLASDASFTIRNIYKDFLSDLIHQLIERMSFEVFKLTYFRGRSDILESFLPNQEAVNISPKLQEHSSQLLLQNRLEVPSIQKSGDSSLPITELSPNGNRRIRETEITPEAVIQAGLNDCYLMAALASLAATPHGRRVLSEGIIQENLFQYSVRFFRNPETGNDMVPQWFRVQHQERENRTVAPWVRVIEQAYAQLYQAGEEEARYGEYTGMGGSRGGIDIGGAARAFSHLTGRHGSMLRIAEQGPNQLWERIEGAIQSGRHVVAGTSRNLDTSTAPRGVRPGHNYSVLDAIERGSERIVQIRNPWGRHEVASDQGIFELSFNEFATNFLQIAVSDFPDPDSAAQGNSPTNVHPKLENEPIVSTIKTPTPLQHLDPQIQRQLGTCEGESRNFGSVILRTTGDSERNILNYYISIYLNLFLEVNLIEGLEAGQIQTFITESLNRHGGGLMTINDHEVHVNWGVNWLGNNTQQGRYNGRGSVNHGLAVGVSVLPGEMLTSAGGLEGMSICENGVHRIVIDGDHAFGALNTEGRGARSRQRRREETNLFGNEVTHELGHSLGLTDLGDTSTVMHHSNSSDFRRFNGEQIKEIVRILADDPNSLPDWLVDENQG